MPRIQVEGRAEFYEVEATYCYHGQTLLLEVEKVAKDSGKIVEVFSVFIFPDRSTKVVRSYGDPSG